MTDVNGDAMDIVVNQPPLKKLKQGRLPFKVISPKVGQQTEAIIPTTPPSNKKRKLSDTAPGPNKASKTPRNDENVSKPKRPGQKVSDAENEVSSSSEAEFTMKKCSVRLEKCKRSALMDQFVRKPQQLEVSTTNLIDSSAIVDLTDSNDAEPQTTDVIQSKLTCEPDQLSKVTAGETSKECDTNNVLLESVNEEEEEVHCDSTEVEIKEITTLEGKLCTKSNNDALKTTEDNVGSKDNNESDENMSCKSETKETPGTSSEDKEIADDSLNETAESDKDSSVLSDTSQRSQDDSLTEMQQDDSAKKSQSSSSKNHKTPVSDAKRAEREAEKVRKQQEKEKIKLEKQKEKEEKERLRKEEKEKKEREKEEAKKKKEQEKKEKVEQKEREKQEKLKQKEEEKKKKEEERLKKQEEKQKELEEKQRQKEEKEKEKEEAKAQNAKVSEKQVTFFSSFFTKKEKDVSVKDEKTNGNFIQFEVKSDMRLAPLLRRKPMDSAQVENLDSLMLLQNEEMLYLQTLRQEDYKPGKGEKTWPSTDLDIILMDDKPEKKFMKAKFLSFHENNRPPYRGTWTKKSKHISARNPLAQDKGYLDYEVDSDEEWEEEEPGESVSDSGGEEDGEPDDEDDDDGFFVPHGYLSEGEGCEDEDEDANPDRMKARQLARAKAFEMDMKKKTELLKPVCTGCCWWEPDQASNPAIEMLNKYQVVGFNSFPINLMCNKYEKSKKKAMKDEKKKAQPQHVPEEAIPALIRLVHGNRWSVQKLIREFREYWRLKSSSGLDPAEKGDRSLQLEGNEEDEADTSQNEDLNDHVKYSMSKRQVDKTIKEIAMYERRSTYPVSCWYVHDAILEKENLKNLTVPTQWVWVTKDPNKTTPRTATPSSLPTSTLVERSPTPTQNVAKEGNIMKFAKPGISPKFSVVSPKPVPSACSTPTAQGKGSILNKFKQETPKRDSPQAKITPSSLFQPIEKAEEVSSSDCIIDLVDGPGTWKPDKSQPTLLAHFKGSGNAKANCPKPLQEVVTGSTLTNHVVRKNCVEKTKADSTGNSPSSSADHKDQLIVGSAECPMEID